VAPFFFLREFELCSPQSCVRSEADAVGRQASPRSDAPISPRTQQEEMGQLRDRSSIYVKLGR